MKLIKNLKFKIKNYYCSGFSLLEILVVVAIFGFLGILVTRSVLLTLSGSKKSESIIKTRENLNYTLSVIERQLRNASFIADCTNSNTSTISYIDQGGNSTSFSCANGHVASGSAQLTNTTVNVSACSFVCSLSSNGSPSSVTINLTANDTTATGTENSVVTASTQIFLRNY